MTESNDKLKFAEDPWSGAPSREPHLALYCKGWLRSMEEQGEEHYWMGAVESLRYIGQLEVRRDDLFDALLQAFNVLEGLDDDEINEELLPRLRRVLERGNAA